MFFKASVGPGVHTARLDLHSLAFVEEYWRPPEQPTDPLCSEFKCVRLYSTTPKVYYVIDTWRILRAGSHYVKCSASHYPSWYIAKSAQQRKREYPSAAEDSKPCEGDRSPQWIVNMWAMKWGSKRPTPGEVDYNCLLLCLSIIILLLLCVSDPPELSCSFCSSFSFSFSCCFSKQFCNSLSLP